MKKRALALFMAVILTLQMTGCNTGTKEQDTTAENKTQSSIKDLFNSGRNDKEDGKEPADDERESAGTTRILRTESVRQTAKMRTRRYDIRTTTMSL